MTCPVVKFCALVSHNVSGAIWFEEETSEKKFNVALACNRSGPYQFLCFVLSQFCDICAVSVHAVLGTFRVNPETCRRQDVRQTGCLTLRENPIDFSSVVGIQAKHKTLQCGFFCEVTTILMLSKCHINNFSRILAESWKPDFGRELFPKTTTVKIIEAWVSASASRKSGRSLAELCAPQLYVKQPEHLKTIFYPAVKYIAVPVCVAKTLMIVSKGCKNCLLT